MCLLLLGEHLILLRATENIIVVHLPLLFTLEVLGGCPLFNNTGSVGTDEGIKSTHMMVRSNNHFGSGSYGGRTR